MTMANSSTAASIWPVMKSMRSFSFSLSMSRSFSKRLMCRSLDHTGSERGTPEPKRDDRIPIGPSDV